MSSWYKETGQASNALQHTFRGESDVPKAEEYNPSTLEQLEGLMHLAKQIESLRETITDKLSPILINSGSLGGPIDKPYTPANISVTINAVTHLEGVIQQIGTEFNKEIVLFSQLIQRIRL